MVRPPQERTSGDGSKEAKKQRNGFSPKGRGDFLRGPRCPISFGKSGVRPRRTMGATGALEGGLPRLAQRAMRRPVEALLAAADKNLTKHWGPSYKQG